LFKQIICLIFKVICDWLLLTGIGRQRQSSAWWLRVQFSSRFAAQLLCWHYRIPSHNFRVCKRGTRTSHMCASTRATYFPCLAGKHRRSTSSGSPSIQTQSQYFF